MAKTNTYKRANGSWEAKKMINGQRKSFYARTQKEVLEKLRAFENEMEKGTYIEPQKMKVGEWLSIWCNEYTADIKDSTRFEYFRIIEKRLAPSLGSIQLQKLRTDSVQALCNSLAENLSARSVEFTITILKSALSQAVKLQYVKNNAAANIIKPRKEKKEMQILANVSGFLQAIENHTHKALFTTLLWLGCRRGEVLGLSWSDINFEKREIVLRQQLAKARTKGGKAELTSLKNGKTRRLKVIPPEVFEILREHKKEQLQTQLLAGQLWSNPHNLVFVGSLGSHLDGNAITRSFQKVLADNNMEVIPLHALRHTAATLMLQNGVSEKTVSEQLGHFSVAFTLDTYAHVTHEMEKDSASKMQGYIDRIKAV